MSVDKSFASIPRLYELALSPHYRLCFAKQQILIALLDNDSCIVKKQPFLELGTGHSYRRRITLLYKKGIYQKIGKPADLFNDLAA